MGIAGREMERGFLGGALGNARVSCGNQYTEKWFPNQLF